MCPMASPIITRLQREMTLEDLAPAAIGPGGISCDPSCPVTTMTTSQQVNDSPTVCTVAGENGQESTATNKIH